MAAAYGLYSHIQSNKRRSIALLLGLFFLVYLMVFAGALLAEALTQDASLDWLIRKALQDLIWAAPIATVATAAWIVIAYFFNQSLIDAVTGGREVTRKEQPRLYNILENLCISRGITMPKLKVTDDSALNAFASGLNERQYSITVTSGLLDHLDDKEIEAVLGHELTHIRNGDVRMLVIAVIIAGVIGFFAELLFRMVFQGGWRWGGGGRHSSDGDRGKGGGGVGHRHRHRAGGGGVAAVRGDPLRIVAKARISRRRRLGGTDQGPRRHDLGAAQDRRPRRAGRCNLRGHGNVHRQPPRGLRRPVRHPSADRKPDRGADPVCRRPRSRPARTARRIAAGRAGAAGAAGARAVERRCAAAQAVPAVRAAGHARRRDPPGQGGPWGGRQS